MTKRTYLLIFAIIFFITALVFGTIAALGYGEGFGVISLVLAVLFFPTFAELVSKDE